MPPIFCAPLVKTPPRVSVAGVKFNTPEVIVAPFAFPVPEIAPKEVTPLADNIPVVASKAKPVPIAISPGAPAAVADLLPNNF